MSSCQLRVSQSSQAQSLPALTGETAENVMSNSYPGTYGWGALRNIILNEPGKLGKGAGWYISKIHFNASSSNSIYSGTKVTPLSRKVTFILKY